MNSPSKGSKGRQSGAAVSPNIGQMRVCDPQRLAKAAQHWRGTIALDNLERFASAIVEAEELVQWQARFNFEVGANGGVSAWLTLEYSAHTQIACGLCAEPLGLQIDEVRRFSFATDEDVASRLDEQAEDYDVIVAEPSFDLLTLIEDELILALPVFAQHETCPMALPGGAPGQGSGGEGEAAGAKQTQRPFADLATQIKASKKAGGQARGQSGDSPPAGESDGESGGESGGKPNGDG